MLLSFEYKRTLKLIITDHFMTSAPAALRKTRAELMKDIDAFYYGYGDEDDGVVVPLEIEAEKQGRNSWTGMKSEIF